LKSFGAFKDKVWNVPKEQTEDNYGDMNIPPQKRNQISNNASEEQEERQWNDQRGHPATRGQMRGRGRGRAKRGGQPGKSVFKMTAEEIENKEKLKKGRDNQTRKKGGHHDHKEKANKKYGL
jgi:hypothetical protein